ncbi:MAG: chaperonin GroEL, partial [Rhodospirillales bacterium]|nr:chaperonin GroEL [Rhodospirillales bacterium]
GELTEAAQLLPALEAAREAKRSLLVLAQDVSDQALAVLLTNHREGTVSCVAVKGPESGIYRHAATDDVAVLTGGRLVGEDTGLTAEKVDSSALGTAKRAIVDGVSTTIFGGGGEDAAVDDRAQQLRDAIESERKTYDRGKYEARLARLVSGVANIRVGGVTETAWKARYKACENALNTARAAAADGVVAGGGVALARAAFAIENGGAGAAEPERRAFARALQEPFRRIAGAAGCEPSIALETLREVPAEIGFDARTGGFRPYREAGVIDATRVTTTALTNAAVTAGQLLSTGCAVALARRPDAV